MAGDGAEEVTNRDIVVCPEDGPLSFINELNPTYIPLHFPLLFSRGELGWQIGIPRQRGNKRVTIRDYAAYYLMLRNKQFSQLHMSRRLFQEWIVDLYANMEQQRLTYIRLNQRKLR